MGSSKVEDDESGKEEKLVGTSSHEIQEKERLTFARCKPLTKRSSGACRCGAFSRGLS